MEPCYQKGLTDRRMLLICPQDIMSTGFKVRKRQYRPLVTFVVVFCFSKAHLSIFLCTAGLLKLLGAFLHYVRLTTFSKLGITTRIRPIL